MKALRGIKPIICFSKTFSQFVKTNEKLTEVKFHYLHNVNGKGLVPKALLNFTNTQFRLFTYKQDQLDQIKHSALTTFETPTDKAKPKPLFEYFQVPILEFKINNTPHRLAQAKSISSFIANTNKLMGDSPLQSAQIQSIFDSYEDFWQKLRPIYKQLNEFERANIAKNTENFIKIEAPKYLAVYERRLTENGGVYMVGDRFSAGDVWVCCIMYNMFKHTPRKELGLEGLISKHAPRVNELVDRVKNNELKGFFDESNDNGFVYSAVV